MDFQSNLEVEEYEAHIEDLAVNDLYLGNLAAIIDSETKILKLRKIEISTNELQIWWMSSNNGRTFQEIIN